MTIFGIFNQFLSTQNVTKLRSQCWMWLFLWFSNTVNMFDCFRENTVEVHAFVRNSEECQSRCSENAECGYYKYFPSSDLNQPLFCYHLRKCAPRVIRRAECPLEKNNYIGNVQLIQCVPTSLQYSQKLFAINSKYVYKKICILLQKIAFWAFLVNCKNVNGF